MSVPRDIYEDCQRELASLRSDHLTSLLREVEARQTSLSIQEQVVQYSVTHRGGVCSHVRLTPTGTGIEGVEGNYSESAVRTLRRQVSWLASQFAALFFLQ